MAKNKRKNKQSGGALPAKIRSAMEALHCGDVTRAEILTREFLSNNPRSEIGLRARLDVYSRLKNFQGAVEVIGRLLEVVGENKELFFDGAYYAELGGNLELALQGYEKVLEMAPLDVQALLGLGRTLLNSPGIAGAGVFFARAYELEPENQNAAEFLALAYEKENDFASGIPFCEKTLQKFPHSWNLLVVLANLWGDCGKSTKGLSFAQQAMTIAPNQGKPYIAAAYLLDNLHRPFEALGYLDKASKIAAGDLNIFIERSSLQRVTGRTKEALDNLLHVFRYAPRLAQGRSNYLLYLHDINGIGRENIFTEHKKFGAELGSAGNAEGVVFKNTINADRGLVIGILSSDLRVHSVAYFLYPLLASLDKDKFKLVLFSNNVFDDRFTDKFKEVCSEFVVVRNMQDSDVADAIRERKVDILLELNGHTAHSRLLVCSYRAAPVQINWLGYPDTTGVGAVDYRIVDSITDPVGNADEFATEELLRMENGFLCYNSPEVAPAVSISPIENNLYITYGSFNNFAKINPDMIALWSRLLLDNPQAKLLLKNHALTEDAGKEYILTRFTELGVERERLLLYGTMESLEEHLGLYSQVDIALDTFPYNGTTTTFEALYMGVPVVTLCGQNHAARVGASVMTRIGLKQLVAKSAQEYLLIAEALGRQVDDLVLLRKGMRERLSESGVMDSERFAAEFSGMMVDVWKRWVGEQCQ